MRSCRGSATCSSRIPLARSASPVECSALAFATWATAKRNPWATAYGPVLIERGLQEPPKPGEPGQFALGAPDEIEPLVLAAGFDEIAVEEVPIEYRFREWEE